MKNLYLSLLLLVRLTASAQDSELARLDQLTEQARTYFNNQQADSLYALAGEEFHREITAEQFRLVSKNLFFQVGRWLTAERQSFSSGVARYKATFERGVLGFAISRNAQDKIHTFLFRPYEAEAPPKTGPILTSNPLRTALDRQIDAVAQTYMRKSASVGLCLGIVRNDSVFLYGYGETALGNGKVPDGATLFEIGSISKTFTATLLALAVRSGKVKLDDPVNRYLPDSIPALEKDGAQVTLNMLSNHSSGLPRLPTNLFSSGADQNNPYKHYGQKELFTYLKGAVLQQKPGERYEYSNLGVGLLGTVLEGIYRRSYEQLLQEQIVRPLKLANTTITLTEAQRPVFAQGHSDKGKPVSSWEFQSLVGAGGIRSSVNDMLVYLKAAIGQGPRALTEAMELTQQPTFTRQGMQLGLGWHRRADNPQAWFWHNGRTGGYSSFSAFSPARKSAVVVLTNGSSDTDGLSGELIKLLN